MTLRHAFTVLASLLVTGCRPDANALKNALLDADREFARDSQTRRLDAWLDRVADSGVIVQPNRSISRGRGAAQERLSPLLADSTSTLNWEPILAESATAGDLGYTVGLWQNSRRDGAGPPEIHTGKYVTIWRRQPDGAWTVAMRMDVEDGR